MNFFDINVQKLTRTLVLHLYTVLPLRYNCLNFDASLDKPDNVYLYQVNL